MSTLTQHDETETYTVYRCDRIVRWQAPQNEVAVATGFRTAREAMDVANAIRRADKAHSYTVGCDF